MKNLLKKFIFTKTGLLIVFLLLISIFLLLIGLISFKKIAPNVSPTANPIPSQAPLGTPKDQGQLDYEYNQSLLNFDKAHPWYNKLPPRNKDYFIGYDSRDNSFFVELYPDTSLKAPVSDQVITLKKEVTDELNSIGVNLSSFKITWGVYPK